MSKGKHMITAQEARNMTAVDKEQVEKLVELACDNVRAEALKGNRRALAGWGWDKANHRWLGGLPDTSVGFAEDKLREAGFKVSSEFRAGCEMRIVEW